MTQIRKPVNIRFKVVDGSLFVNEGLPERIRQGKGLTTRDALRGSILKWRAIFRWCLNNPGKSVPEDGASSTCPLCWKFMDRGEETGRACIRCPVFKTTGKHSCKDTPYYRYVHSGLPRHAIEQALFLNEIHEEWYGKKI